MTAEYNSTCPFCHKKILVGTKISKDFEEDAWMHARCLYRRNNPKWGSSFKVSA